MTLITGIGSRQTPRNILDLFEGFGRYAKDMGWCIRSGHAPGADYAFERGCKTNCIVYLPWKNFNHQDPILGIPRVNPLREEVLELVYKYEPYARDLPDSIKKIKSRNIYQVLGENLNIPSNIVICWTPNGEIIGGTGLALKVAQDHNITIYNLGVKSNFVSLDKLVEIVNLLTT